MVKDNESSTMSNDPWESWDEFIDVCADIEGTITVKFAWLKKTDNRKQLFFPGHKITVSRRNLERADGDWVDPNFFAEDFSVAAATGFQVGPLHSVSVCSNVL